MNGWPADEMVGLFGRLSTPETPEPPRPWLVSTRDKDGLEGDNQAAALQHSGRA